MLYRMVYAVSYVEGDMLVTFKTKEHAGVTMFGKIAMDMVKMMGHSPNVPGAILAEDIPAALNRLEANIETRKDSPPPRNETMDEEDDEPPVSIAHRAMPLIDLLKAAAAANNNVMWEKASFYN